MNGKASEVAARLTRSGSRYVEAVKSIQATAPELIEKIRGGQLNIPNAKRVADLSPSVRAKVLQSVNGQEVSPFKLADLITQARTEERREKIKKARKPGGLCLAYCGQMYLPQVLAAMARHLHYWWVFAVRVADQPKAIYARSIQARWKPVVAFAKPPMRPAANWLADWIEGGGRDKRYHEWGQAEAEAVYLIQRLTEPGELVVDPYAGGGAFPAAAKATNRRWLATERDEATAVIARKRLAGM